MLDRLCLEEGPNLFTVDPAVCDEATYRESLLRDLNTLLNTRATLSEAHRAAFPEVGASVLAFGLPEVSRTTVGDERAISQLAHALTEVIRRFEPRLSRPHVSSTQQIGGTRILFRLEGEVKASPAPIKLVFDTTFNADAGRYAVEEHVDEG